MKQRIILITSGILAAISSSCSTPNRFAESYSPTVSLEKSKPIPASQASVEEFSDEAALKTRMKGLRQQGYVMLGHSLFDGEYAPTAFAKTFAAEKGCERVLVIRRRIGQGVGTRMETASYTAPSMGFANTTLYTPSGRSYSAVTTVFNPAQSTSVARDYVYDYYRHGAAFFARPNAPTNKSAQ